MTLGAFDLAFSIVRQLDPLLDPLLDPVEFDVIQQATGG